MEEEYQKEENKAEAMAKNGEHAIDFKQLTCPSEALRFHDFNYIYGKDSSIFKIPTTLYRQNEKAYVPDAFSIGPWHLGKEHLKPGQDIKWMYLGRVLHHFPSSQVVETLEMLEARVSMVEKDARACYAGPVGFTEKEFVNILVLDGCFIIELFREFAEEVRSGDALMDANCMLPIIHHDLLLLENQIPWFVLQLLFDLIKFPTGESMSLVELATSFFSKELSHSGFVMELPNLASEKILHMIDLVRRFLILPPEKETPIWNLELEKHTVPSISRLKHAGVRFQKTEKANILDIDFKDGVLQIPSLIITPATESTLRNLISFEQCYPSCPPMVTCYAMLMDNLIDSPKDVELLCHHGIFNNWLNPEEVAYFFNRLHNNTNANAFYYADECKKVNEYCRRWWPKWRAFYLHNYFGKPWALVAQAYALVVLVLTILPLFLS